MSILISLNGDTPDTILTTRAEAMKHMRALDTAMRQAAPHGRNYASNLDFLAAQQVYENFQRAMNQLIQLWVEDSTAAYRYKTARNKK